MGGPRALFAFVLAACAHLETPPEPPADPATASAETIQRFFADHPLVSLEVAVVKNGQAVFSTGVGDVTPNAAGVRPDLHTHYRIGSLTKLFTGLALEQLRVAGKLSFDDRLVQWIPEASALVYPTAERPPIRLRNLMTHTAGLPRDGPAPAAGLDEVGMLRSLYGLKLELTPDTEVFYSNLGMALAGVVIERASGEPYLAYVERHLLSALGLGETSFDAPPAVATAFCADPDGPTTPCARSELIAWAPAGGLFSTAFDLARFAIFELSAWPPRDDPDDNAALSRGEVRETHAQLGPTTAVNWFITHDGDTWGLGHSGLIDQQASFILLWPAAQVGVVILGSQRGKEVKLGPLATELGELWREGVDLHPLDPERRGVLDLAIATFNGGPVPALRAIFNEDFQALVSESRLVGEIGAAREKLGHCELAHVTESAAQSHLGAVLKCKHGDLQLTFWLDRDRHRLTGFRWSY